MDIVNTLMVENNSNELMMATIFGSIIFFVFTAFCVSYLLIFRRKRQEHKDQLVASQKEFQAQLLQSQVEVQELTYNGLSRELHDNVGQLLNTALLLLGLAEREIPQPPDTLKTAYATLGDAINELRSLSKSLNREWLEQFNLLDNLTTEVKRLQQPQLSVSTVFPSNTRVELEPAMQIILFRIIQEAMQNAIKHAQASNIQIHLEEKAQQLLVRIIDNGKGFNAKEPTAGLGIKNMQHRVHVLGGQITWESMLPQGTTVQVSIPIKQ
ncbi:histidine kinase [Chitinophaga skermanii]|uniref:Oxygen sensor histidine kinase NreB n=1 Tax=Chitinophaga skermanii TaxID=331697 RepID=A0A327Q1G6_9BACT|nr:sensor histidine kinase [Chitinophaga skermanii]RAI97714.1 histidine kinase [Chitinophaga skermanii]